MPLAASSATDQRFASARLLTNTNRRPPALGSHAVSPPVVKRSAAPAGWNVAGTIR